MSTVRVGQLWQGSGSGNKECIILVLGIVGSQKNPTIMGVQYTVLTGRMLRFDCYQIDWLMRYYTLLEDVP